MLQVKIRMISRQRFLRKNIDRRTGDPAFIQGTDQVRLHNDAATAHVDDHSAGFHLTQGFEADQPLGPRIQRTVNGNHIAALEEMVQVGIGLVAVRVRLAGSRIIEYLHAEGLGDGRHPGTDVAQAHRAESLAFQLEEGLHSIGEATTGAIGAALDIVIEIPGLPYQIEDVHPCDLRYALRRIVHRIAHGDSFRGGILRIHVVGSRGRHANEFQGRIGIDLLLPHPHFVGNHHVKAMDTVKDLFGPGRRIGDIIAQRSDRRQGNIIPQRLCIQKYDLQHR